MIIPFRIILAQKISSLQELFLTIFYIEIKLRVWLLKEAPAISS
jgi:hypothetical protein